MTLGSRLPKLIYITARGHSGSTLTELLIGAHSQVFTAGEIKAISRPSSAPGHIPRCRCGVRPAAECPFWSEVDAVLGRGGHPGLLELSLDDGDSEVFRDHNLALLGAIASVSGASHILDSSKSLERLRRLIEVADLDVEVVYLTREPLGVVYSNLERGRDLDEHARQYTVGTFQTRQYLAGRRHVRLRYERVTRHPQREIGRVMRELGLRWEPSQLDWAQQPGHSYAGNTMRFARSSEIRHDGRWLKGLGPRAAFRIGWLTLPTRLASDWLYEAHLPYWKGEGVDAWRAHRRSRREAARRQRRHRLIGRFPKLRPVHELLRDWWRTH